VTPEGRRTGFVSGREENGMSVIFAGGCGLIGLAFVVLSSIFWIWMIVDCATNPSLKDTDKIVWILVVIFLHLPGALVYYFVAKNGGA
jgi:cytochrome c oxidase assembly factor CtaG